MGTVSQLNFVKNFVTSVAQSVGFKEWTIDIEPHLAKGEGYLGSIIFVTVKGASEQLLNLVIKLSLADETTRDKFSIKEIYNNEIYFYSTIATCISEFQKIHRVETIFENFPKYYGSRSDEHENYEIVCLENMKINGFEVVEKTKLFDSNHMELAFRTFAKFHAVSFAYKHQKPEKFTALANRVKPVMDIFINNHSMQKFFNRIFTHMEAKVKELGNSKLIDSYKKYVGDVVKVYKKSTQYDPDFAVFVHGDAWSSNLMFKYDRNVPEDRKPIEMCLLDWQLIDVSSPVRDLLFCFFSSGCKEQFNDSERYLRLYHDQLSSSIRELGSEPELLYPYTKLKEEWTKHAPYGLFMSAVLNKLKLTDDDHVLDFANVAADADTSDLMETGYDKETYERRFMDIVEHLYQINAL